MLKHARTELSHLCKSLMAQCSPTKLLSSMPLALATPYKASPYFGISDSCTSVQRWVSGSDARLKKCLTRRSTSGCPLIFIDIKFDFYFFLFLQLTFNNSLFVNFWVTIYLSILYLNWLFMFIWITLIDYLCLLNSWIQFQKLGFIINPKIIILNKILIS